MADKSRPERPHVSSDTVTTVLKRVIAENGRDHLKGYGLAVLSLAIVAATAVNGKPVNAKSLGRLNWTADELVFVLERKKA